MPILLTDPLSHDPGHGLPVETYNHVKIVDLRDRIERKQLILVLQYGNKDGAGVWTGGKTHPRQIIIQDTPQDPGPPEVSADPAYSDFMANTFPTSTANQLRVENAAALYAHLIAEGFYAGTVV